MDSYVPVGASRAQTFGEEREERRNKVIRISLAAVAIVGVLLVIAIALYNYIYSPAKDSAKSRFSSAPPAATPPVSIGTSLPAEDNVDGYNYALDPMDHEGGVIIDGGFPAGSTAEEKKKIVAEAAARDPFVLNYFLERIYGIEEVPPVGELEDRDLRIKWHQKLLVLLDASEFKSVSLAGKTFFNEGHSKGKVTARLTSYGGGVAGTEVSVGDRKSLVKDNCVNKQNVGKPSGVVILKPSKEGKPLPKPKPKPKPRKAPDATNGAARQPIRDRNAVRTPTPGYPGRADEVIKDQNSRPRGGTDDTPYGTPGTGTGAGATTPPSSNGSGETNSGGGQSDPTPPPGGANTGELPEID